MRKPVMFLSSPGACLNVVDAADVLSEISFPRLYIHPSVKSYLD